MALQLLYTNSPTFQGDQPFPAKSLGGFISNTLVEDRLNNLFDSISKYGLYLNKPQYRCIALYNDSPTVTLTGLQVYIEEAEDSDANIQGVVSVGQGTTTTDDCGDLKAEQTLSSVYSVPRSITFTQPTILAPLVLGDLAPQVYKILWIKRAIDNTLLPLSDADLEEIRLGTLVLPTQENISLKFDWT